MPTLPPTLPDRRRLALALLLATTVARADEAPVERWLDLTPPGWNPYAKLNPLLFGRIQDGSPEAVEAMERMREALDAAPTVPELEGRLARLPGYVVPLQSTKEGLSEFLLVPYFGACIHTPPPPANQIIYVRLKSPQKSLRSMDAVRVLGRLRQARQGTASGESGYRIDYAEIQRLR
jgi:hypothetical protein